MPNSLSRTDIIGFIGNRTMVNVVIVVLLLLLMDVVLIINVIIEMMYRFGVFDTFILSNLVVFVERHQLATELKALELLQKRFHVL
jgi:hypothetical protein